MNKIKLLFALCAIMVAGSYTSCNKMEKNGAAAESADMKAISAKFGFRDFPTVENGMLQFRDDDHYISYLQFLDDNIEGIDSTDTVNDEHTVLQKIENGLKFTSLRKISHEAYERQDAIGWPSLEAIPDEHFILAPDIRSTLNSNKEVMIGDEIVFYVNKNCAVRVLKDRTDLLARYKRVSETETIANIIAIDPEFSGTTFIELNGNGNIFRRHTGEKPTGNDPYIYFYKEFPDICQEPGKVKFEQLKMLFPNDIGPANIPLAYFKINFGDGSPIYNTLSSTYDAAGFYYAQPFQHAYPNTYPASYTMTITASTDSNYPVGDQTVTQTFPINITGFQGCAIRFKNSGWQYTYAGNNEYIGGMLDIEEHEIGKLRVVAYSKLVKETSPGVFNGFKGKLYTDLLGEAKTNDCIVVHQVDGSGANNKAKTQKVHRTPDWPSWSEYLSNHVYVKNGQEYLKHIVLHPCN